MKVEKDEKDEKDEMKRCRSFVSARIRRQQGRQQGQQQYVAERTFCNKGCRGTLYQDGRFPESEIVKHFKRGTTRRRRRDIREMVEAQRLMRSGLMYGRKTLLDKNGFYYGMKQKTKRRLSRAGAISGCVMTATQ
jgi:hypothetical protein